jgi:hypothetical protein
MWNNSTLTQDAPKRAETIKLDLKALLNFSKNENFDIFYVLVEFSAFFLQIDTMYLREG